MRHSCLTYVISTLTTGEGLYCIKGYKSKCFYLMWVSKCFSQHLLDISHDSHLLMSSQWVFYPLGCGGTLYKWVTRVSDGEEKCSSGTGVKVRVVSAQICVLCTRSLQWSSLRRSTVIQCDATWRKKQSLDQSLAVKEQLSAVLLACTVLCI